MPTKAATSNSRMRNLPSVDEVLRTAIGREIALKSGEPHAASLARRTVDTIRQEMSLQTDKDLSKDYLTEAAENRLENAWRAEQRSGVRRVINATGVIIHTNLGRAPFSENALRAVADEACGYCTVEYDLATGKRGKRGERAERLLAELTGAESVLIVNNCAAAAFFVLTVFASGGEVVISRGEIVEIGGDFRVPDVLAESGATLREVGTTNRTKLADYKKAINDKSRILLRVHPSNYRIVGFTATPSLKELADLAHRNDILLYEDIGSGALIDLTNIGLGDEPVVRDSIVAGADVVTFSGDKLLGGPQAGIVAGRKEIIDRLRSHPLYRVLRIDKLANAALETTLESFRRETAFNEIPVLQMLSFTKTEIAERAYNFAERLRTKLGEDHDLTVELLDGVSAVGGGAAPAVQLETKLIALSHPQMPAPKLEKLLRDSTPPVIARIADNRVILDLRTVTEGEEAALVEILGNID